MKPYFKIDEWSIIEEGFDPGRHEIAESIFSIGNGHMGQRANFEEAYSGKSLQGSYLAGVYYPDKTRVGWWKNGYPEYFAKVLNATNWIGLGIEVNGEELDLAKCAVRDFVRVLRMREGRLERSFTAVFPDGRELRVSASRFVSIVDKEIGAIRYAITPLNFDADLSVTSYLDGNIRNKDSNYDEGFWDEVSSESKPEYAAVTVKTKKLDFHAASAISFRVLVDGQEAQPAVAPVAGTRYAAHVLRLAVKQGQEAAFLKFAANVTSRDYPKETLTAVSLERLAAASAKGYDRLQEEQAEAWEAKWKESDIIIEGDPSAQQAIRFAIFQLNQTYSGEDSRLNIGPKGFTGEKYGGSTYWDTEAYCLPFYLSTAEEGIARNLLVYRHKHLEKAKENAAKLGFSKGALYPMVTMNGEECHNEWEITFEEIHRNGAIAYAIYNYVNYTGDTSYLGQYGLEVLAEISRFWEERVNLSTSKGKYVMLGVTGPNEYENNVNNNWYTSRIAVWTLEYTLEVLAWLEVHEPERCRELKASLDLKDAELAKWREIAGNMYYPYDPAWQVFLQQDGFLDKELIPVSRLDKSQLPLNQKWSWDRILRSCYIKQADVLQGLFFLGHLYDRETVRRNFDFYEPLTVHESSLSPCVHAILACELGYREKAYEMYLRTARLDLDNYNNDTEDGCHITSMAGTWMSVVQGFGGLKVRESKLVLNPFIPGEWRSFSFKVMYRGARLQVSVTKEEVTVANETAIPVNLLIHGAELQLAGLARISAANAAFA